jgi:MFS family permease
MTGPPRSSASETGPGKFSRAMRRIFHSLRHRNFRLFFIGQLISNTGNWLTRVALILLVLKLTGRGIAVGLVTACEFGPVLFLSAWAGAIADRHDKRRLLLLTQSLEMAQSIGLAILAFLPYPPLDGLYVLALIGGILLAFDNPLRRSFVTEMVPSEDIPNAVVLYSTIVNLSRIFGPALAGLLVVTLGYGWSFTIDATSYVAVILCLVLMRSAELDRQPAPPRNKSEIRAGLRYVSTQPRLWVSFVMLLGVGMFSYNFSVTLPLFVTDSLHRHESVFTILYSIFSCGAVVSGLLVADRALVQMRYIIRGAALLGVAMLLLAVMPGVVTAAIVLFLVGMASILYMTSTTALAQVEARRDMHGRVLAIQTVLLGGTRLVGGPALGWLADLLGGRAPIAFGGAVSLLAAAFGYWMNRRHGGDEERLRPQTCRRDVTVTVE